jgi:hypothetical protein
MKIMKIVVRPMMTLEDGTDSIDIKEQDDCTLFTLSIEKGQVYGVVTVALRSLVCLSLSLSLWRSPFFLSLYRRFPMLIEARFRREHRQIRVGMNDKLTKE